MHVHIQYIFIIVDPIFSWLNICTIYYILQYRYNILNSAVYVQSRICIVLYKSLVQYIIFCNICTNILYSAIYVQYIIFCNTCTIYYILHYMYNILYSAICVQYIIFCNTCTIYSGICFFNYVYIYFKLINWHFSTMLLNL